VYLTARSYLLAGFTAASIVAATPLAPRPTIHLPSIHAADVRLAAAESEIASAVRTLHAIEVRTLASAVDRTATTVVPGLARRSRTATDTQTLPGAKSPAPSASSVGAPTGATDTNGHQPGIAQHATTTTTAGPIAPSDVFPLIGDVAAFNFDLLGTPFGIITALSFAGDLAISDLSSGLLGDIPGDVSNSLNFGIGSEINLLSADINTITNELNHLTDILNPAPPSDTQTTGTPDTVAASNPVADAAPPRTADPSAIGPLIGDTAALGLDVAATPFQLTQSLTRALSAAALDLGAGQVQFAEQDFATNLRIGLVEAQTRLGNDLNSIGATLARLTGVSNTTARQVGAANQITESATSISVEEGKAASPSVAESRAGAVGPRSVVSKEAPSAPVAESVSAKPQHTTAHVPKVVGTTVTDSSTASQEAPTRAPKTANQPPRQGAATTANTNPATPSPGQVGAHANGTNTSKHSAPGPRHAKAPKHRKH
jgi:hypothetical protein